MEDGILDNDGWGDRFREEGGDLLIEFVELDDGSGTFSWCN